MRALTCAASDRLAIIRPSITRSPPYSSSGQFWRSDSNSRSNSGFTEEWRGGSGCGGVSRMDAATELTWTYLQRPPQPDPPRHSSVNPLLLRLLLSLWPLRVQGAALPN